MMQAVIMAGGKGTRLAALTKDEIPKPMVPVAGKPLLLWQVERLKENGITDIVMVIGHLGEKIREYFGDGEKFGVSIRYFGNRAAWNSGILLLFKGYDSRGSVCHDVRRSVL